MKNAKIASLVLGFLVFVFIACALAKDLGQAPNFKLQDTQQNTITLSTYRASKPVILFFWTTWCPFCRWEIKTLNERYAQFKSDGVEFFAINISESAGRVEQFIQGAAITYPVLLDKSGQVSNSYGLMGVPTYIFINKAGNIVFIDNQFSEQNYKEIVAN